MYILHNENMLNCTNFNTNTKVITFTLPEQIVLTKDIFVYSDDIMPLLIIYIGEYNWSCGNVDDGFYYELKLKAGGISVIEAKQAKIEELSNACELTITNGIDVGDKHYSLTLADQLNLESLKTSIMGGMTAVPYHADNESCTVYSATDFLNIYKACAAHKIGNTTYFNQLKQYVNSLEYAIDVEAVTYGQPLTGEYLNAYNSIMEVLPND